MTHVAFISSNGSTFGYLVGLAYFNWFTSDPISVPWWGHLILVFFAVEISVIIVAVGSGAVAMLVNWATSGDIEGRLPIHIPFIVLTPLLGFLLAYYSLLLVQTWAYG